MSCCPPSYVGSQRGRLGTESRSWVETATICVEPEVRTYATGPVCAPVCEPVCEPAPAPVVRTRVHRGPTVIRDRGAQVIGTKVGTTCDPCRPAMTMPVALNTVDPGRAASLGASYVGATLAGPQYGAGQLLGAPTYTVLEGDAAAAALGPRYGSPSRGYGATGASGALRGQAEEWAAGGGAPIRLADGSFYTPGSPSQLNYNYAATGEVTPTKGILMDAATPTKDGASPARFGLGEPGSGSVVRLSDGSLLLPDGSIQLQDGTIRRPANVAYRASAGYNEKDVVVGGAMMGAVNQQLADLKARLTSTETAALKSQLQEMELSRRNFERELEVVKQSAGENSVQVREKESEMWRVQQQFVDEVRRNAEALGLAKGLQQLQHLDAQTLSALINEAVLRREQELHYEKERALADTQDRLIREREAHLQQERSQAEKQAQSKVNTERARLQADVQRLQDRVENERRRAEAEHEQAAYEKQRALAVTQELEALQALSQEKKKKKKKKGKKGRKGKKKAKKAPATRPMFGRR